MNNLTNQERIDLEQVFAAIYVRHENKLVRFYWKFYNFGKNTIIKTKKVFLKKARKI